MVEIRPVVRTSTLLVVKILLIMIVVAWAANSGIQSVNYTGESGGLDTTNNQLLTTAQGFSKVSTLSAAGTSCGSAVTYGSGTVANTPLTGGDVIFDAQVNTTATTPSSTCFTVTFYLFTSIATQSSLGPVYISTGSTVTPGQAIDCKFDLGSSSLPTPPFSYKLAVQ
jgi:hypothetical protein